MYKENPQVEPPSGAKSKVWRYMTLEKYKALLESQSLYFCRGEKLRVEDPYEGMPRQPDGDVLIPVDLQTLIEAVYVSPRALPVVRKDVDEATRISGLDVQVLQSELLTMPAY